MLFAAGATFLWIQRARLGAWVRAMLPRGEGKTGAEAALASAVPWIYSAAFFCAYVLSGYGLFATTWEGRDPETHAHIFQLYPMMSLRRRRRFRPRVEARPHRRARRARHPSRHRRRGQRGDA
ncbi:MAG: hypothetical protein M5R36_13715 [Deltaproteobacteria bacterium]|nr:hypothetical protein [Deltaproteobacteria bacterium]